MKFIKKIDNLTKTDTLPNNHTKQKEIILQRKKDGISILKQQQQNEIDAISQMETQLTEIKENIETQKLPNQLVKKHRLILIVIVFGLVISANIFCKFYLQYNNNMKLAEYSSVTEEKEKEYQSYFK